MSGTGDNQLELRRHGLLGRSIHTETLLQADCTAVWRAISDLPAYADWNPVMTRIDGEAALGAEVDVHFNMGLAMHARCRVGSLVPGQAVSWQGGPPGLLRGDHYFECLPEPDGRTRYIHGERFTGLLVPLIWPMLAGQLRANYLRMNRAMAERVSG